MSLTVKNKVLTHQSYKFQTQQAFTKTNIYKQRDNNLWNTQ